MSKLFSVTIAASTFKICHKSSPNLAQCVKESIELIRPNLKTGNFGNGFVIDPLEPLKIEDIIIERGNSFHVSLTNIKAIGAMNFKINKLRINVDNFRIDAIVDVPKIQAYGDYKLNMLLGVLNLRGEGTANANIGEKNTKVSF